MGIDYLIFGNVDSRDYDILVFFKDVDHTPKRVYQRIAIPGRNGEFFLDENRFEDVQVSYDCIALNDTDRKNFVNALSAQTGHARLTDTFNIGEYCSAVFDGDVDPNVRPNRDSSTFTITFTRKPQRWLTSGEDAVTMGEYTEVAGTDNEPYLFRASPQFSDEYDTEIDKIVGGTVAWNQLAPNNYSRNSNGSTAFATGTPIVAGHKYLLTRKLSTSASVMVTVYTNDGSNRSSLVIDGTTTATIKQAAFSGVSNGTGSAVEGNAWLYQYHPNGSVVTVTDLNIIDLTAMFGTTIADAIYAMEQATAGSGVAWFKALFSEDYYPYSSGELKSVEGVSAHIMTDSIFHDRSQLIQAQFDPNTGTYDPNGGNASRRITLYKLPVDATKGNQITVEVGSSFQIGSGAVYDSNGNYLQSLPLSAWATDNATFDIRSDAHYFSTNFRKVNDTAVTPSEIKPYISYGTSVTRHSYELDSTLTLRGIPKLSDGKLYYDGDTYESDGTVTRKYGVVDLGTLTWTFNSGSSAWTTNQLSTLAKKPSSNSVVANIMHETYPIVSTADGYSATANEVFMNNGGAFYLRNGSNSTQPSGYLIYELATPTTETADSYASPQIVDAYGTEEYVSTSIVPAGHDTQYGENPNKLDNPTLFESSPLLEVEGYGNIEFNGYEIEIENAQAIGDVVLINAGSTSTHFPAGSYENFNGNEAFLNIGDTITVPSIAVTVVETVKPVVTIQSVARESSQDLLEATIRASSSRTIEVVIKSQPTEFQYGTAGTSVVGRASFSWTLYNTVSAASWTWTGQECTVSAEYDGDKTITFLSSGLHLPVNGWWDDSAKKIEFPPVVGTSTQDISLGHVYIDCDLGEAYKIESGGAISLNRYIDLGSDLPKLAIGANEITYDDTITELKVAPRWWKV